ncbi:MAG: hypothetical protein MZW92_08115 [Comamonadaceae bacterium]|nr:hypothetical protein [Comamonadaceae bacterium]
MSPAPDEPPAAAIEPAIDEEIQAGGEPPELPPAATGPADDIPPPADYAARRYLEYAMSVVKGARAARRSRTARSRCSAASCTRCTSMRPATTRQAREVGARRRRRASASTTRTATQRCTTPWCAWRRTSRCATRWSTARATSARATATARRRCATPKRRLTPIAELLLAEIDRRHGRLHARTTTAPSRSRSLLPARLPFVLLNGASGIAVGMATEIPPHNLREVAEAACHLIRNPKPTLDDVLAHDPRPGLPGRRRRSSPRPRTSRDAYADRSRQPARARAAGRSRSWRAASGAWSSPSCRTASRPRTVLSEIESLHQPAGQGAGKKVVSPEQQNLKAARARRCSTRVRDESSDKAPRAPRARAAPRRARSRTSSWRLLLAHTSLETNASINLTMLGRDGRPQPKDLLHRSSREWIDVPATSPSSAARAIGLDEVERRIHILEGRHDRLPATSTR